MSKLFFAIAGLTLLCGACAPDNASNQTQYSGAAHLEDVDTRNLKTIMEKYSQGIVANQPWAGYWWPYTDSGIASVHRDPQKLSPADKYDMAYLAYLAQHGVDVSQTGYHSAAAWERLNHGAGLLNVATWWGHCDGWAAASIMVPEPHEAKIINGVTFNVRDQKALLTESWLEFTSDFIGNRVTKPDDFESAAFWDVVPAQFHLILADVVAKQGRGLILDRYTGDQVWNQPLVAFAFDQIKPEDYLGAHPQYPDVYRVNLAAQLWWASDDVDPDLVTPKFSFEAALSQSENGFFHHVYPSRRLHYELWLDGPLEFDASGHMIRSGNILLGRVDGHYVGGLWKNGVDRVQLLNSHPDYMWMPYGISESTYRKNPHLDEEWVAQHFVSASGLAARHDSR